MQTIIKVIIESISQAVQQLVGNKLRSFLSLLGITSGIFCIIGVFSAVDSLENNIRKPSHSSTNRTRMDTYRDNSLL